MTAAPFAPWWIAGPALAAVTVAHWVLLRRLLGVSGILQRVAFFRDARRRAELEAAAPADAAALEAALLAETLAAFGPEAVAAAEARAAATAPAPTPTPTPTPAPAAAAAPAADASPAAPGRTAAREPPLGACVAFLLAVCAGGTLSAALRGGLRPSFELGQAYERIVAPGAAGWAVLVAGGFLVGAGTGLCGGCTSGHGLSGCSRLQKGSLAATAAFLAAAVAVSLALAGAR